MNSGLQVLDSGLFLVSRTWIQDSLLSCQSCPILPHCYGLLRAVDGSCAPQYKPSALPTVRILHTDEACISLLHQSTVYARFAICTIRTDQQTVYTLSCREIFYVPLMGYNFRIVNSSLRTVREFCNQCGIVKWLIRTVTVQVYWTTLVSATLRNTQRTKTQKLALDPETLKHAQYRKKHTGYDTLELDMLSS